MHGPMVWAKPHGACAKGVCIRMKLLHRKRFRFLL